MLNDVVLGKFYPGKSRLHKFSPILKFGAMLIFIISVLITKDWLVIGTFFLLLLLLVLDSGIPLKYYYKALENLLFLFFFLVIVGLLTGVDKYFIAFTIIKIMLLVLYSSLFIYTTTNVAINHGLNQICKPLNYLKVKTSSFILMISLAIRFIPTVLIEANKIYKSQASRGIDFKHSSLKGRLTAIKSMFVPMFYLSIRRADKLAEAMELRLYNINAKRTNFRRYKWHIYDVIVFFVHIVIFIFMIKRLGL